MTPSDLPYPRGQDNPWGGKHVTTEDKPAIVFKSEASLWDMMVPVNPDGRSAKPFNMRRWDLSDERIYRLAWGRMTRKADSADVIQRRR